MEDMKSKKDNGEIIDFIEIKDYKPKSCYGECNECGLYTEEE